MNELTKQRAEELILYDPESGLFHWKHRKWGLSGSGAGCRRKDGYVVIRIDGILQYAHRVAWLLMTGKFPDRVIDHKDTNPSNNRWENLRSVSMAVNSQNIRAPRPGTQSGFLGVQKNHNGWQATIMKGGKRYSLGTYSTPKEAHAAYVAKKRQLHEGCTI